MFDQGDYRSVIPGMVGVALGPGSWGGGVNGTPGAGGAEDGGAGQRKRCSPVVGQRRLWGTGYSSRGQNQRKECLIGTPERRMIRTYTNQRVEAPTRVGGGGRLRDLIRRLGLRRRRERKRGKRKREKPKPQPNLQTHSYLLS